MAEPEAGTQRPEPQPTAKRRRRFGRVGIAVLIGIAIYLFGKPYYTTYQLEKSCTSQASGHWNKDRRECTFGGPDTSVPAAPDNANPPPAKTP